MPATTTPLQYPYPTSDSAALLRASRVEDARGGDTDPRAVA